MKSFPGFKESMRVLRGKGGKPGIGNTPEDAFFTLLPRANEYIEELLREFQAEEEAGVRLYLLELIAEAGSPLALPVLIECLRGDEPDLWVWAISGLRKLNSKEARRALWEARSYTKATSDLTRRFLEHLDDGNS